MKSISTMIQKWRSAVVAAGDSFSTVERHTVSSDRRDYGMGLRLWDDKDPRADQSFFLGGVPGFVLSQDQRIIDWNLAFEIAFKGMPDLKRGMPVSEWYKSIDNFRRVPNREAKLYGEALIPITDRERVVFLSPIYGRIVFMKIMSPILDRLSGRIIGWNITLNINSVSERVKFFEDLYKKIDQQSRHARYVVGTEQILSRSPSHREFVSSLVSEIGSAARPLIIGAVKAEPLVEMLLARDSSSIVTVLDSDAEALRLLKSTCERFKKRLRLVRREWDDFSGVSFKKFDAVVLFYPKFSKEDLFSFVTTMSESLNPDAQIFMAGYSGESASTRWWQNVRGELERSGHMDVLKWHWQTVADEDKSVQEHSVVLPIAPDFAQEFLRGCGLELSAASFGLLSGSAAILVASPKSSIRSAV